ncbi:serine hydrolase domain-containing protein [Paenibacillus sp. strain BS8-2]
MPRNIKNTVSKTSTFLYFKIGIGLVLAVVVGFGVLTYLNRPLPQAEVNQKIKKHLEKLVDESDSLSSVLLTISSGRNGYHEQFAVGTTHHDSAQPAQVDSPYHSASIGKTMLAAVFGQLVDEGIVRIDDTIATWLSPDILDGLFTIDGVDHSDKVTIRHLLSHTSGVGDYFEGPVTDGEPMLDRITANPDLTFTPASLLSFTRDHQQPVGLPGQQFYYSDTGYILLGLLLEAVEGKAYGDILEERIFGPLGMKNSRLMFHQEDASAPIGIYLNGIDFSDRAALSVDWSGGGVVTTMDDLLMFMKALVGGHMLSDKVYEELTRFNHRYDKGIRYGMGMMYFDFSELSFLLGSMSDVYGTVGATGTYALYDKEQDTYYIANFGSLDFAEKSIEELVKIRMIYDRIKKTEWKR